MKNRKPENIFQILRFSDSQILFLFCLSFFIVVMSTIHKSPIKQAMIRNLVEVFETIRPQHMNLPMAEIWQMVVEHPAKSFYLSRQRIKEIILNYRTK